MSKFQCILLNEYGAPVATEIIKAKTRREATTVAYGWALGMGHYGAFEIRKDGKQIDVFRPATTPLH
jgi:hypothetical protein